MSDLADLLVSAQGDPARRAALLSAASDPGPIDLTGDRVRGIQLDGADLTGAVVEKLFAPQASFIDAVLERAHATGADFSHADFTRARLGEIGLRDALLEEASFADATLRFADMRGAAAELAVFDRADLWGARLEDADFTGASLRGARVEEAFAARCTMRGVDLRDAVLTNTDLTGASLADADLRGARFAGTRLSRANLSGAKLADVDLCGAHLDGACWSGARLDRTQMTRVQVEGELGEQRERRFADAATAYGALERNFASLGDTDSAAWAYRCKRRMQKFAARSAAADAWREGRRYAAVENLARYLGDLTVEWTCDYGESVTRVLGSLFVVFVGFTLVYGITGSVTRIDGARSVVTRSPLDLAIFSLMAMTTSGTSSGILNPSGTLALFLASLQALLGIFLTGLLGFVAGNRIRR